MLQLSWLNNMVLLREEQIKEKVNDAVLTVSKELAQYKGNFLANNKSVASGNIFTEDYSARDYLRPLTIGRRFSAQEIYEKIKLVFIQKGLEEMDFEFAVEIMNPPTIERQSQNYQKEIIDTVNNHSVYNGIITNVKINKV